MDDRIDLICQHTMEGDIIPLRIRLRDEEGELQEYTVKVYRSTSGFGRIVCLELQIPVQDTLKIVEIYSSDCRTWRRK